MKENSPKRGGEKNQQGGGGGRCHNEKTKIPLDYSKRIFLQSGSSSFVPSSTHLETHFICFCCLMLKYVLLFFYLMQAINLCKECHDQLLTTYGSSCVSLSLSSLQSEILSFTNINADTSNTIDCWFSLGFTDIVEKLYGFFCAFYNLLA